MPAEQLPAAPERTTLSELFATDPIELTTQDLHRMSVALREQRVKWAEEDLRKQSTKTKKVALPTDGVSFDDLDL